MNVVAEVVLDDQGYPYVNWHETSNDFYDHYPVGTKFCATWVGLTDEELRQVWYDDAPVEGGTYIDKLRQVEAKLKEKNT